MSIHSRTSSISPKQGAGTGVLHEIGHLGWSCECGCAFLPLFVPHLGFKSKNNVKFCNSASYKSPKCIYSFIVPTLDILGPGFSDLFLFSHSSLISRPSVSGILYFLFKSS